MILESCFDFNLQANKSNIIEFYNKKVICYSFLLSYKLILIVTFPYIPPEEYEEIKKNSYILEYFLLDIEFFENKVSDEKIDYNKYSQHEEILSYIKSSIAENFKKVFCNSVYQGCLNNLPISTNDINTTINACTRSHIEIDLTKLFYLMQEIFLIAPKSQNKYENIKIISENSKLKHHRKKSKKKTFAFDESSAKNVANISPNSPYLRKFKSIVSSNSQEELIIPSYKLINEIFCGIIGLFFKQIDQDNEFFVSYCQGVEFSQEEFHKNKHIKMLEYLNFEKKVSDFH